MTSRTTILAILSFILCSAATYAQKKTSLEGRWDLQIVKGGDTLPSWLEILHSGHETFVGRYVYAFGSARPISEVKTYSEGRFGFAIPRQWEPEGGALTFHGALIGDHLEGTMMYTDGSTATWTGTRAPELTYRTPTWGPSIQLFNGENLDGWHTLGKESQWSVVDGILTNTGPGANLVSNAKFEDFILSVEFRYPEGSNSGIYLRGRYEVQIDDAYGLHPSTTHIGGLYGFLEPNQNASRPSGEWQTYLITLVGRRLTVELNGEKIITEQNIPGITGGALDSEEAQPGPIMIQGDHGPIEFRSIRLTPALSKE